MKKMTCLLLSLVLLLSLAACHSQPDPTHPATEASTTAPATTATAAATEPPVPAVTDDVEVVVYDLPMTAITLTEQVEATANSEGVTVFEYHYQNVWLQLADADLAGTVILDLLNRIDGTRTSAESVMQEAAAANPEYPYSFTVNYVPERIDSGVLSLSGRVTSYNGGSHANTSCTGITYDLTTGNTLTLADVLTQGCTADIICRLTVDALSGIAEENGIYDDYSAVVEDRFAGDFLADTGWYLSGEGLCFDFAPYEIAPYSSGVVTATIPYDALVGVLEDAWFPVEQISAGGTLLIGSFDDADLERYDHFIEIVLDSEGTASLLTTDSLLYNITIELGSWNAAGTVFTPESSVFAADCLSSNNAIVLQAASDTGLRITYTADDTEYEVGLVSIAD